MQKKRLGISLYPEFATQEENFSYLERAAARGFDVLFIALLAVKDGPEAVLARYRPYMQKAHELGFEIFADVNPMVFEQLGVQASLYKGIDLSFFKELGIDALRLDLGMSDLEEAALSKNREGIKICLNGASTVDHIAHVLELGGDPSMIVGSHNYYPHRYTGFSLDFYQEATERWAKRGLRLQTFVSSNAPGAFGPWPVSEGLPTLEMHRDLPIGVQMKHFVLMGGATDVLIANCFATDEELDAVVAANTDRVTFSATLAEGAPAEQVARASMNLSVRPDCTSGYLVRALESRIVPGEVEPFNTVAIERGDILVDNKLYGQYNGEVQIALRPMENSGKTNVIGHIDPTEHFLLDYLKGGQSFAFDFGE